MPHRSILSATERAALLALPESQDDPISHYTFDKRPCRRSGSAGAAPSRFVVRLDNRHYHKPIYTILSIRTRIAS